MTDGISRLKFYDKDSLGGRIIEQDDVIEFRNVPIMTPGGELLINDLNMRITSGMNCLITGPNGSGKSSLFRVLGELWPIFGGILIKPHRSKLFYVPQRPYLTLGTLRDQVIYPRTSLEALNEGFDDDLLLRLLDSVQLSYLVAREGGWDATRDWYPCSYLGMKFFLVEKSKGLPWQDCSFIVHSLPFLMSVQVP